MGFLKNLVGDAVGTGIGNALSKAVEKAVAPAAERFANKQAEAIDNVTKKTADVMEQSAAAMDKAQKDLEYQQKFLAGVRAKLSNEKFTAHAPAQVIENERKKEADALSKIESLEAKIAQLSK